MTDKQLTENFIRSKLGDSGVAEYYEYLKAGRKKERDKKHNIQVAHRNPSILDIEGEFTYYYGRDFFSEGEKYYIEATVSSYLYQSVGLEIRDTFSRGYYKLESTAKYFTTIRKRNGYGEDSDITTDDILDRIISVLKKGSEHGTKEVCGNRHGASYCTFLGFPDIKKKLYTDDELRAFFSRCFYRVWNPDFFAPELRL